MPTLNIKIKVKDKIEAWKIVTHLGFKHEVEEAIFENKVYKFDKVNNKSKDFLRPKKKQKQV